MKFPKINIRLKILIFSFLGILFILIAAGTAGAFWYINSFCRTIDEKPAGLINQLTDGIRNPYTDKYLNILVLGLDKRPGENSLLTDTILVVSFDVKTGDYLLFSIPRDLWLPDLQTKINALYYYGQQADPDDGTDLMVDQIEQLIDISIDYALVLEMADIKNLVDLVGGITVNVERSFVDNFFPRDDGSHQVMTISFDQGEQLFDGEKALQYMRSRQSDDEIEGTDQARQARQKKVILAIRDKLVNDKQLLRSPKKLGELYNFLMEEVKIKPKLSLRDISSFWPLAKNLPHGQAVDAEMAWRPEDKNRILEYGFIDFNGRYLWVMKPIDNNWDLISDFYRERIF